LLGKKYDPALAALANSVARWVRASFDHDLSLPRDITVSAQQPKVARAVIGHLLAADENPKRSLETKAPLQEAMRSFFLDEAGVPSRGLRVCIWPYPGVKQVIIRAFGVTSLAPPRYSHPFVGDLLKFYPLCFFVTIHPIAVPGYRIGRVDLGAAEAPSELVLPLNGAPHPDWPERMRDNEALLVANHVAYVGSPSKVLR
jgi:hypothetical protein